MSHYPVIIIYLSPKGKTKVINPLRVGAPQDTPEALAVIFVWGVYVLSGGFVFSDNTTLPTFFFAGPKKKVTKKHGLSASCLDRIAYVV